LGEVLLIGNEVIEMTLVCLAYALIKMLSGKSLIESQVNKKFIFNTISLFNVDY